MSISVQSKALPQFIDPRRLSAHGKILNGHIDLNLCDRLQEAVVEISTPISSNLSFYVEDQSRKVVRVKSSVTVKIMCQRCLVAMPLCLECDTILCIVWTEDEANTLPKHLDPWIVEEDKGDAIQLVEDELLLALPFVAYHNEDKCNSLTSSSNTDADYLDNNIKLKRSPFAVLKGLKNNNFDDQ